MEWALVGVLFLLLIFFFSLYWRGVKERNDLVSFIEFLLLSDEVYKKQKDGLRNLIEGSNASTAIELAHQVNSSVSNLAKQLGESSQIGSLGLMWELKTSDSETER